MAIALRKPIFLFRDDIRRVSDTAKYPINLMIFIGLPEHGCEEHYYTAVEEISSPHKTLALWAADMSSD